MGIHKTAIIYDGAQIDESAEIGPYAVIGANVQIEAGTTVGAHAVIDGMTTVGSGCRIFAGAAIGLEPQDLGYKGEPTGVVIGDRTVIREYVTIHRATREGFTQVGSDCFLMNYVHIAHNCKLGNGVILANSTMMAGYVTFGDNVVTSGMCIFHQHVRIGRLCMISGLTGTRKDLPPFAMCDGRPAMVRGVNSIGLKRNGIGPQVRTAIKEAYRLLYRSGMNLSQALPVVEEQVEPYPEIREITEFIKTSKRGVTGDVAEQPEIMDEVPADVL